MNMDVKVIDYFKRESERTGIPCQNIINMHLLQCVEEQKHVKLVLGSCMVWEAGLFRARLSGFSIF